MAQSIAEIIAIKDPNCQIEAALKLSERLNNDTIASKKKLQPILEVAIKNKNKSLEWTYYMMMADAYSIAHDQTNASSDNYYYLANVLLKKNPDLALEMIGNIRQGYYNFVYRKVTDAFPFFLHANDLKPKINIKKLPLLIKHYQFMASFFSHIGDHKNAVKYLKEALPYSKINSRERIDLTNSIAVYLSKQSLNKEALHYYQEALIEAKLAKDSAWIGIISGNLADYAWNAGDKSQAINLIKDNINLSIRHHEYHDAMRANLVLAGWYVSLKQWNLANKHVIASKKIMEDKPYFLKYHMDAAELLVNISNGLQDNVEELKYTRQFISLKDSLEGRTNLNDLNKIVWQNEKDKYNRIIQSAGEERHQSRQIILYFAILLILIFTIVILLINKSKVKIKMKNTLLEKEQIALSYEKQLLDQELSILKNSLSEFTDTIKQNNNTIQKLRSEINLDNNNNIASINQINENLNAMLQTNIMTDERWIRFKYVFDKVHPNYLLEMRKTHEKITENDLKILALQKLNLSNTSMSDILCVSLAGIKKAKQRLKKKMDTA